MKPQINFNQFTKNHVLLIISQYKLRMLTNFELEVNLGELIVYVTIKKLRGNRDLTKQICGI
jgi:hypothetical protein